MRTSTLLTAATMVSLCVVTVLSAVVESFLVLYELVPGVSVAIVPAVVGNLLLTRAGKRAVEAGWGGFVLALLWLGIVVALGVARPEGDLVVAGTGGGLFMLAGVVASVVGIATGDAGRPTSPNGPVQEGSSGG